MIKVVSFGNIYVHWTYDTTNGMLEFLCGYKPVNFSGNQGPFEVKDKYHVDCPVCVQRKAEIEDNRNSFISKFGLPYIDVEAHHDHEYVKKISQDKKSLDNN